MPVDPAAFLRATPPFDGLPAPLLAAATAALDEVSRPAGTRLVRAGGTPFEHLWIIRAGVVRLERDGRTMQVLEEGEVFGYTSLLTGTAPLDVVVEEDLVAYRLPAAEFRRLLADARFAGHFATGLGERLRRSLELAPAHEGPPELAQPVEQLVSGPAAWVSEDATVGDAARVMRARGISSVLVRGAPPGIVTDRDFRGRVLAEGLGPETPVAGVATRPLREIAAGTPVHAAWTALLDAGVHHLPVVRDGDVIGVVTSTDLLRCAAPGPMAVLRRVEGLASRAALPGYAAMVARMAASLQAGGLDALAIAALVARLNDALVRRILAWGEHDLGPAPAPYAWLALGSEGRREQTLLTDQDNAIVFADAGAEERAWFVNLAERANADLEAAGFPRCRGDVMARSWNGTLSEWRSRVAGWLDAPTPRALLDAATFADHRAVAGALDVAPLGDAVLAAVDRPPFLRFLARAALDFHPPAALTLRLRAAAAIDLKKAGIAPVVFLARAYGLEARAPARATVDRLDAAVRAGLVDERVGVAAAEAFRVLLGLRLREQLRAAGERREPEDTLQLATLSAVERSRVKDAFRAVRALQDAGEHHFHTRF
ncbi:MULTISPECIES: DUF294 nucleotidyltransferase-like domain-containing protein [unclassified Anaeromyxobacter]|uniref:DUF294 nucleotidyltransferase-like domain-containing protein n=1 Tax=unclassified Anaeromyxobacter TaxID=2620896 RepID=UPI001F587617|nr:MULTISPECIES: DUF294 nucleotidyltransferase-like domain-containing protein [unclassified Anaeromyxobacter]